MHELTSCLTSWFFGLSLFSQICVILLPSFVPLYIISHVGNAILRRRRKEGNPESWQYLDSYLKMKKPGFAVYINGEWGSGKTFFIKHYIVPHNLFKIPCYISLFGVDSKKEFDFRVWKGILFTKIKIAVLLGVLLLGISIAAGRLLKNFPLWSSLDFWSFAVPIAASVILAVWCFAKLKLRDLMLKKRYLVLDDFERAEVDYPILMAWISELVEHRCCSVIIIGNEQEIIRKLNFDNKEVPNTSTENTEEKQQVPSADSFDCEQYKRMKEKVIGKEISLAQHDDLVVKALTAELPPEFCLKTILHDNTDWFISEVLTPLHSQKIKTNYRALEHVMHNFCYHFSSVEEYIENEKLWRVLIPRYFSVMYCIEIGELLNKRFAPQDVQELFSSESPASEGGKKFIELYPFWRNLQQLLSEHIWKEFTNNEAVDYDDLRRDIDYFLNPKKSLISRWYSVFELDDSELNSLMNDTEVALRDHQIHSPEDIFFLARTQLSVQKLCGMFNPEESICDNFGRYIDEESQQESFIKLMTDREVYSKQRRVVEFIGDHYGNAEPIRQHLLIAMDKAHCVGKRSMFDELLNVLKNNENLVDWFNFHSRRELDIYSGNDPDRLLETLDSVPAVTFRKILDIFQVYLVYLKIETNRLCIDEFQFWDGFIAIARKRKEEWHENKRNVMKGVRLRNFIDEVSQALDKYAEEKGFIRQGENNGQDEV